MSSKKQILVTTVKSTTSLAFAFVLLLVMEWGLKSFGAWFSDFPGIVKWDGIQIMALAQTWNLKQVLGIYLFPYVGFVLIYLIISIKRRVPLKLPSGIHLVYGWFYTLLIVIVFLVPVCELFYRRGIYYALSWLYFNRFEKILFIFVLLMLYTVRVFRISPVFSSSLVVKPYTFIKGSNLFKQLIFLWYIPYLLLFISVIVISTQFSFRDNCFLVALLITLLVNTPLIAKYKVIIK